MTLTSTRHPLLISPFHKPGRLRFLEVQSFGVRAPTLPAVWVKLGLTTPGCNAEGDTHKLQPRKEAEVYFGEKVALGSESLPRQLDPSLGIRDSQPGS